MLVLTRKVGEEIVIGDNIHIAVVAISGNKARIGISAPKEIVVDREELREKRRNAVSDGPFRTPTPASLIDTVVLLSPGDKTTEKIAATECFTNGAQAVESAQAIMDRETISSNGFGSVEMNSDEQMPATTALNCQEQKYSRQSVTVNNDRP